MWKDDFESGMLIGTGLMAVNLILGFVSTILLATTLTSLIAGTGAFL